MSELKTELSIFHLNGENSSYQMHSTDWLTTFFVSWARVCLCTDVYVLLMEI